MGGPAEHHEHQWVFLGWKGCLFPSWPLSVAVGSSPDGCRRLATWPSLWAQVAYVPGFGGARGGRLLTLLDSGGHTFPPPPQAPYKPLTSPLHAPYKPLTCPLQAPYMPLTCPLQAPYTCPLQAPYMPLTCPLQAP